MMTKRAIGFFVCLFFALNLASVASAPADLAGHWKGYIDIPNMKIEFDLDFEKQDDGTWTGDISIPAQGAQDLPLSNIKLEGTNATFAIAGVPGEPTFNGTFSEDGKQLTGNFTQSGQTFPFQIDRE